MLCLWLHDPPKKGRSIDFFLLSARYSNKKWQYIDSEVLCGATEFLYNGQVISNILRNIPAGAMVGFRGGAISLIKNLDNEQ